MCSADIEKYQQIIGQRLPFLSPELVNCTDALCSSHTGLFDSYVGKFIALLLESASQCFPYCSPSSQSLIGWNDGPAKLKEGANFWYKVWEQAGQPSSGVLFELKRDTKREYKNSVRCLKRRQGHLLQGKLAHLFTRKNKDSFWSKVKKLNRPSFSHPSVIDGVSGDSNIANAFASNLRTLLNTHSTSQRDSLYTSLVSSVSSLDLQDYCCDR